MIDKAKGPAVAAGAALVGAAGLAAARNGKRSSGILGKRGSKLHLPGRSSGLGKLKPGGGSALGKLKPGGGPKLKLPGSRSSLSKALPDAGDIRKRVKKIDLPKPDAVMDWVEERAKGVGDAGYKVADATADARRVKKAVSGD